MTDFKKETIAKHARILANLGCKFKIIEADGTEHGDLVLAKAQAAPRVAVLSRVDYKTPLASMDIGDVVSIAAPSDMPVESLRSSMAAFANNKFGIGAITTTIDRPNNAVLALRVE